MDICKLVSEQIKALPDNDSRRSLMYLMAMTDPWLDSIKLEAIVDWSGEDFEGNEQPVLVHVIVTRFHGAAENIADRRISLNLADDVPVLTRAVIECGGMETAFGIALKNCCDEILRLRQAKSQLQDMRGRYGVTTTA